MWQARLHNFPSQFLLSSVLHIISTPTNSAPSTPTKPRSQGRALSLSPQKSPSKLSRENKRLLAEHQRLLSEHKSLLSAHTQLQNEHDHMMVKYSTLADTHTCVTEAYAASKLKWRNFKDWLYGDDAEHEVQRQQFETEEDKAKYRQRRIEDKRRKFRKSVKALQRAKEATSAMDSAELGRADDPSLAGSEHPQDAHPLASDIVFGDAPISPTSTGLKRKNRYIICSLLFSY
jgi:hypothetical protein